MYIGTMDSENYSWMSLGNTVEEAKEAIREQWNHQQRILVQNGIKNEPDVFNNVNDMEKYYDIDIVKLNPGECKSW